MDTALSTIRRFVLCTHLPGESPDTLSDDTPLQSSGILDSLAAVGLITFLEKEFQVELDVYDTAIERFDTIRDIASTVVRKQTSACPNSL
jgi:acyl carrier protein